MKSTRFSVIFVSLFFLLSLSACGTTIPPEQPVDLTPVEVEPTAIISSQANTDFPATSTPVQVESTLGLDSDEIIEEPILEVDTDGMEVAEQEIEETYQNIPVGFTETGHAYIGDLNAPVVIEEYSDYQCPFCARFVANTMGTIKQNAIANGEAVLIFYDYPLDFHPQAPAAANAARCAGERGAAKYWEMHDLLFETLSDWSVSNPDDVLIGLGESIGLGADYAACVQEMRYEEAINADFSDGLTRGVTGTPSFFLNGQMLVGAQPIQIFDQAIETLVAGGELPQEEPQETAALEEVEIPPFEMPEQVIFSDDVAGALGDPDAPIRIVEFTDYQCPFCGRHSAETMPIIIQELIDTGRAYYVLKDFPLDSIHPDARQGSVAARCAGEEGLYWEMHDAIFANQAAWGQGGVTPETINQVFVGLANNLGIDVAAFETCLIDGRYDDAIEANYQEGVAEQISGTPSFFIDGYFLSGAQPFEVFDLVVSAVEEGTIENLFREAYESQVEQYRRQIAAQQAQAQAPQQPTGPVEVGIDGDPFIGDPDAPITIIEFTDYQCPFCVRHFENTYPTIKEEYIDTGIVKYVFKDFPLNFHPEADEASEAARCANDQGAFFEMHDLLFSNQPEWGGNPDHISIFIGYAGEIGLDSAVFAECLNSGKYTELVQSQLEEGYALGVSGTPTFFINGNIFVGAQPLESFAQAIDSLLQEQEN
ncbi:MAG: thioredoxin domain-containing protein [Chloroflexota bacterium]